MSKETKINVPKTNGVDMPNLPKPSTLIIPKK